MSDFVEECRREWKRLGVPDPIANEMAIDLTADIEEAEAEGGSAEDVLGNSLFDPRRFAAAWASARGVTAPLASVDAIAPFERDRHPWFRPALVIVVAVFGFLTVLAAAALLVGRRGVSMAASIHRIVVLPGSGRLPGPGALLPPFHSFVSGPSFSFQNGAPFIGLLLVALLGGIALLGLAILYRSSLPQRPSRRRLR
ncbi:MAG: hypothetical protein ABSG24_07700 [Acidimicrobiales bacterium]|jgi:hypothetical protein